MSVTLETLRTEVLRRADMVDSDFLTEAEVNSYINSAAAELYDVLISTFEDQYTERGEPATPQTSPIDVSNLSTLFGLVVLTGADAVRLFKLRRVEYRDTSGRWQRLKRVSLNEWDQYNRQSTSSFPCAYTLVGDDLFILPETVTAQSYRIWYVPAFNKLYEDSSALDGLEYWHEYVIVDAAIRCLQKEESFEAVGVLMQQKEALKKRIERAASQRDAGEPARILDVDDDTVPHNWWER